MKEVLAGDKLGILGILRLHILVCKSFPKYLPRGEFVWLWGCVNVELYMIAPKCFCKIVMVSIFTFIYESNVLVIHILASACYIQTSDKGLTTHFGLSLHFPDS